MTRKQLLRLAFTAMAVLLVASTAQGQFPGVTLPSPGANQHTTLIQQIGLVTVTIDYNSPDVTSPAGEDRTGKIWGELVPYGMANLGFGTCGDQCPWRVGANENTTIDFSHDVKIEGKPLAAGTYGLHMIPSEDEWEVIFSNNHTSWGSFFYDASEDALRVKVKPEKNEFHEWLTFDFIDRQTDKATVAMQWEHLQVPINITVDNMTDLYVANLRRELRSSPGFSWQNSVAAANYCLQNNVNLEEALTWAQQAATTSFTGQENFTTLTTLAMLQEANGQGEAAKESLNKALHHPTADPFAVHQFGRTMIAQEKPEVAMMVFETNAERHPNTWPVNVGLARGHSANGRYEEALKYAKLALENAPDDLNKQNLQTAIESLEKGEDIN